MFSVGEKVVCIKYNIFTSNKDMEDLFHLCVGEIYTVHMCFKDEIVLVEKSPISYNTEDFISIPEYRKLKINKIKENVRSRYV